MTDDTNTITTYMKKPADFIPDADWPADHKWHESGYKRCQAWSSPNGRQCFAKAIGEIDKCYTHGGASLRGMASPRFKDGRTSKYMPKALRDTFEAVVKDEELLSLRDDIATMRAYYLNSMSEIDSDAVSPQTWLEATKHYEDLVVAIQAQSLVDVQSSLKALGVILRSGSENIRKWQNIFDTMEKRKRLIDTEQKRLMNMQALISVEETMVLFDRLLTSIATHITDKRVIAKIQDEFISITQG